MKRLLTLAFCAITICLLADAPGNERAPDNELLIKLPANSNGWQYYYYVYYTDTADENIVQEIDSTNTILIVPGRHGTPRYLFLFGKNSKLGLETPHVAFDADEYNKIITIDSATAKQLYYTAINNGLSKKNSYYVDSEEYSETQHLVIWGVLIIFSLGAAVLFTVLIRNKNKKR